MATRDSDRFYDADGDGELTMQAGADVNIAAPPPRTPPPEEVGQIDMATQMAIMLRGMEEMRAQQIQFMQSMQGSQEQLAQSMQGAHEQLAARLEARLQSPQEAPPLRHHELPGLRTSAVDSPRAVIEHHLPGAASASSSSASAGPTSILRTSLPGTPHFPQDRRSTLYAAVGGRLDYYGDTQPVLRQGIDHIAFVTSASPAVDRRVDFAATEDASNSTSWSPPTGGNRHSPGGRRDSIVSAASTPARDKDRGKAWFPKGTVPTFMGEYLVGSKEPSTNPLEWARQVREAMNAKHIEYELWLREGATCLADKVIDRFRLHFGSSKHAALAMRLLPTRAASTDPLHVVEWDRFCFWLVREYITPSHQEQLEQLIAMETCKGVADVDDFCDRFMELCVYSDFLARYTSGQLDETQIGEVLTEQVTDTAERRRHFRLAMPVRIQEDLNREEMHLQARAPTWTFTLCDLQRFARSAAKVVMADNTRRGGVGSSLHHIDLAPVSAPTSAAGDSAVLHALVASVQELRNELARRDDDDDDDDSLDMHLKLCDFVSTAPPDDVVQQRRQAGTCIACGEADHRWADCRKLREQHPGVGERIDLAMAAEREHRGRQRAARTYGGKGSSRRPPAAQMQHMQANISSSTDLVPYGMRP